jgi:putative intracellular protease/amidase
VVLARKAPAVFSRRVTHRLLTGRGRPRQADDDLAVLARGEAALEGRGRLGESERRVDRDAKLATVDEACEFDQLLPRLSDGSLLVRGKTWTGFANSEEDYADEFVGQRIQPFRIEDEARKIEGTNFIVSSRFKPFAVRDANLITGQQQYSGAAAARLIIQALGQ